jgi:hypothetical protein
MTIELKANQIEACKLLAMGESITATADKIGIARATIHRWHKDDIHFIAYLNSLKSETLEATRSQIQASSNLAINTLSDIMKNSKNDIARILAAKEVLAMAGFTKDSMVMYSWGIGGTTPEKVKADKKSDKIMESLTMY